MRENGYDDLLIAFIMLSSRIGHQRQEESVVTIKVEDALVSRSAIGTEWRGYSGYSVNSKIQ